MTFRSILVPLDGSLFGEHALPYARALARRAGARLELAHVYAAPDYSERSLTTAERDEAAAAEQGRAYLAAAAARVTAADPAVPVGVTLLPGRPGDALLEHITRIQPDLVVLTTHGRGALSRFWLGSIATELAQKAPAPLMLVRPKEGPPEFGADPVPRRILLPLDGSPFGERIVPLAVAVGALAGAAYRLLRVVPPVVAIGGDGLSPLPTTTPDTADEMTTGARDYLSGLVHRTPALAAAETHVAVEWPTASAILADAGASNVDLIAMETRGRSGLAKLLLGSVADKVVRGATIPVLLSRPVSDD